MKINLVILLLLIANLSYAQKPKVNEKKVSSFFDLPIENVLGIVDFDLEVLAKRLRLKKQSSEYRKLGRIISWYETKTDSVYQEYKPQLEAIESTYWRKVAEIDDINDFDQVFAVVREYTEEVKRFSPPIYALGFELDNWISGLLSERQYAKWETYLTKKQKEFKPKSPMPMSGPL